MCWGPCQVYTPSIPFHPHFTTCGAPARSTHLPFHSTHLGRQERGQDHAVVYTATCNLRHSATVTHSDDHKLWLPRKPVTALHQPHKGTSIPVPEEAAAATKACADMCMLQLSPTGCLGSGVECQDRKGMHSFAEKRPPAMPMQALPCLCRCAACAKILCAQQLQEQAFNCCNAGCNLADA